MTSLWKFNTSEYRFDTLRILPFSSITSIGYSVNVVPLIVTSIYVGTRTLVIAVPDIARLDRQCLFRNKRHQKFGTFVMDLWFAAPKGAQKKKTTPGVQSLAAAQKLDNEGSDAAKALKGYEEALALLLEDLKTERDPKKQQNLKGIIEKNMSRAEVLKKKVRKFPPDHHDYTKVPRRRIEPPLPPREPKRSEYEEKMLGEMVEQSPGVSWDDVAGLETAKRTLQEAVVLPYLRPDLYRGLRAPPKGVLLYGPPGTGKTLLAKAVASESGLTFFSVSASSLTSKWGGEGEKLVRALFEVAKKDAPSCIFLDELDSLLGKRGDASEHEASRRLKNEFLVRLDGIAGDDSDRDSSNSPEKKGVVPKQRQRDEPTTTKRVLFIGATNLPWQLDDAVLRRMPRRILIPLPDTKARRDMIDKLLDGADGVSHRLSSREKDALAQATATYSMAELRTLAQEAAYGPLRDLGDKVRSAKPNEVRPVALRDFQEARTQVKPSCDASLLAKFDQWTTDFGVRGGA